jgi:hypothetical protein
MVGSKIEGFILASQNPDNVQINRVHGGGICRDIGERLAMSTRSLKDLASMALPSLVQCGVTIDASSGTSDPDNSCPATKPELTYDLDAAGVRVSRRCI